MIIRDSVKHENTFTEVKKKWTFLMQKSSRHLAFLLFKRALPVYLKIIVQN
jgi:hypothetical protein